jgi:hypothetical protein
VLGTNRTRTVLQRERQAVVRIETLVSEVGKEVGRGVRPECVLGAGAGSSCGCGWRSGTPTASEDGFMGHTGPGSIRNGPVPTGEHCVAKSSPVGTGPEGQGRHRASALSEEGSRPPVCPRETLSAPGGASARSGTQRVEAKNDGAEGCGTRFERAPAAVSAAAPRPKALGKKSTQALSLTATRAETRRPGPPACVLAYKTTAAPRSERWSYQSVFRETTFLPSLTLSWSCTVPQVTDWYRPTIRATTNRLKVSQRER